MALALFEVEPIGIDDDLEANGRVYYFCSEVCRSTFEIDVPVETGTSNDQVEGHVCDECGGDIAAD